MLVHNGTVPTVTTPSI